MLKTLLIQIKFVFSKHKTLITQHLQTIVYEK